MKEGREDKRKGNKRKGQRMNDRMKDVVLESLSLCTMYV
jgi:hypothetical protein